MRLHIRFTIVVIASSVLQTARAQDLAPRAYIITPIHSNAITLSYGFYTGNLNFGNIPITDATARASVPVVSVFHSMNFFGRTANFVVYLPYGVGNFRGKVLGTQTNVYRSGLLDSVYRFSVNLKGGPAMTVKDYVRWKQKTIIGVSLRVVAPTGQYDPTKLINWGNNRWGFKPELGLSRRWGHWVVDGYGLTLAGFEEDPDIHVMMNMYWEPLNMAVPIIPGRQWTRAVDTSLPSPSDIADPGTEASFPGLSYCVNGRSIVVLVNKPALK